MRRRVAGVGAVKNKTVQQARFKEKGSELASDQLGQLSKQLDSFRGNLEEFASKHRNDIKKDPEFRMQFQEMCAAIGVDPLASGKGFWAEMLGVGDFYYELGVQIIEVCMATNHRNGGLISLEELKDRLDRSRGKKSQEISSNDVLMAIKKLKVLGSGFSLIAVGGSYLIQSVPGELTMDHTALLQHAEETGYITRSTLETDLRWDRERANRALSYMVKEGLAWVDEQAPGETHYWFPGLFTDASSS